MPLIIIGVFSIHPLVIPPSPPRVVRGAHAQPPADADAADAASFRHVCCSFVLRCCVSVTGRYGFSISLKMPFCAQYIFLFFFFKMFCF